MGHDLESENLEEAVNLKDNRVRWINLQSNDLKVWAQASSSEWWECIILLTWNDQQWLENFYMSRDTFVHVVTIH